MNKKSKIWNAHIVITGEWKERKEMRKLIIDGNAVYELDENCMLKKKLSEKQNEEEKKNLQNKKKEEQNS